MPDYKLLCERTCEIAGKAAAFMANELLNFDNSKIEKKGLHDLVSYVDKESEKMIIAELEKLIPKAGYIAEEGTLNKRGEKYNWVIDPLDGTTNYIQGIPVYAVSIALLADDELVLGVVYEVGRNECFYAWKDGGAWLNGNRIQVSTKDNIHDSVLATGFPYSDFNRIDEYIEILKWSMTHARGVRRLGSAATDLAYVACGRFDAFWEYDLKPWDVAAGAIIVKEAGGIVTDYKGGNDFIFNKEIVATNDHLNDEILTKIKTLTQ